MAANRRTGAARAVFAAALALIAGLGVLPMPAVPAVAAVAAVAEPEPAAPAGISGDVVAVVEAPDGSLEVEHIVSPAAGSAVAAQMARLRREAGVVAVDVDVPITALATDPYRSQQWPLDVLEAEGLWRRSTGSGVTVAVLDTGVQGDHPDLRDGVVPGADFTGAGRDGRTDVKGHGTHVAGIIAAGRGNDVGTAGLSPDVTILPVQVLSDDGGGRMSWAAEGIIWATDHGADVINMSFGAPSGGSVLDAAVRYAVERGVTLVAASGNKGGSTAMWPAAHPQVIAVGATAQGDAVAPFSNGDAALDVVAPGVGVASSCVVSRWCAMSGTSMAAPHVAAAAAALVAAAPGVGPQGVAAALRDTAVDIGPAGHDPRSGHGRIDVRAALTVVDPGTGEPAGGRSADSGLRRIAEGTDGAEAAAAVSATAFPDRAELAVVARDDVFADALTGAVLAGEQGPVLFTPGGRDAALGREVAAELRRVLPPGAPVFVLGGPAAVSARAVADIRALGFVPQRVAGEDRVLTAAAVADALLSDTPLHDSPVDGTTVERVLLARADVWADAVTSSAYGAATATPILLTVPGHLSPATAAWLADHDVQEVVLLGGEAAVSAEVARRVRPLVDRVSRVGGADRAETATRIAEQLWSRDRARAGDHFVVIDGYAADSWAPAIAAAVLSAIEDAPQLLVRADVVPDGTRAYLGRLGYTSARRASATAVGGRVGDRAGQGLLPLMGRS